jgi:hypothetical protein
MCVLLQSFVWMQCIFLFIQIISIFNVVVGYVAFSTLGSSHVLMQLVLNFLLLFMSLFCGSSITCIITDSHPVYKAMLWWGHLWRGYAKIGICLFAMRKWLSLWLNLHLYYIPFLLYDISSSTPPTVEMNNFIYNWNFDDTNYLNKYQILLLLT